MTHAHDGSAGHAAEQVREANLLGTFSVAVAETVEEAVTAAAAHSGAAPAALAALSTFLDGSSIDTLRRPLGLSHSAAVRLADRLAAAGLVRREAGVDARSVSIRLTREGAGVAQRIRTERGAALAAVLEPLSDSERVELARLHEKLLAGFIGGRADAGHVCRLCDVEACGHDEGRCPVTHAADRAEGLVA
jgi:MarR family transcriptional regulator, negative regulator of the multidrug operon emrRAB